MSEEYELHISASLGVQFQNPMDYAEIEYIYPKTRRVLNPKRKTAIIKAVVFIVFLIISVPISFAVGFLPMIWIRNPLQGMASAFLSIQLTRLCFVVIGGWIQGLPSRSKYVWEDYYE